MTLAQDLRLAVGRFARRLRQLYADGDDNLSFLELAVLQRLERTGPSSPGALAGQENVTSAAIAPVLRRLEEHAFVIRAADPADGRRSVVTISPSGRTALQTREAASITRIHAALATLTDDQRRQLADVIPLLEKVTAQL
ncbi:MarR family winged helix-turn-helix transcriptional regulator [Dactylosporangium sp. NPDC051541]|uniref:MarR family winged helix-turn-helix transcriptional regulator n=1 Tax=Dactylosporangium sp. NPDC051541 TaxID=3363977 RepID=UPI0037A945F8